MNYEIVKVRSKSFRGNSFNYAEIKGTGDSDHASWWSFDDEQELRDRWWNPKPGETVLDIGAAFGSYALPALACGARVVCFSPADFDTQLLQDNLRLNPELAKRCLVVRDGLYSCDGWFCPDHCNLSDRSNPQGYVCNSFNRHNESARVSCPWLRVRTLDSFLASRPGIEKIDWIKIDVEGAELEVLKGAEMILKAEHPKILVENHEFQVKGIENQVRDYLVGLGVGYVCDGPYQHCAVSHSFFEVRE